MQKALSLFEKGPLALVAERDLNPSTSGLWAHTTRISAVMDCLWPSRGSR